jgi:hypothetical protein
VAVRLRTIMLAAAAERRAQWVYRHHNVATVPGIEQRRYPTRTGTYVVLGLAGIIAIALGAVLAALSSFADPTSSLYPVKRTGESVLLGLNFDRVDRAQFEIKLSQAREREAEDMASRGDGDLSVAALNDRYLLLVSADRELLSVPVHDGRWRTVRDKLFKESDVQVSSIQRDLQVTGQDRSGQEVARIAADFDAGRRPLETQLGRPAPPSQAGTPPVPVPTPQ